MLDGVARQVGEVAQGVQAESLQEAHQLATAGAVVLQHVHGQAAQERRGPAGGDDRPRLHLGHPGGLLGGEEVVGDADPDVPDAGLDQRLAGGRRCRGLAAVPAAGSPDGEQSGTQGGHAGAQVLDHREDRLEGPGVAVGVGRQQQQLGTPRLRVAAALTAAYALGAGGTVADLHDVGGQDGGGGAERPAASSSAATTDQSGHHTDHRPSRDSSSPRHARRISRTSRACRSEPGSTRCTPGQARSARCGGRAPRCTTTRARRSRSSPAPDAGPVQTDSSMLSRA